MWTNAGLEAIETRVIPVQRTFTDFEEYWAILRGGPSLGPTLRAMAPDAQDLLKARLRTRLPADSAGHLTYGAVANAVKGRVPKAYGNP